MLSPFPMNRLAILLALGAALFSFAAQAQRVSDLPGASATAQFEERIIAVVNDDVITSTDLNARMAMAFLSSGLPDTPEVRQRLLMQVLHNMIDEHLQLQEAKKLDINVSDDDVDQAMQHIAEENQIPGGMKDFLAKHGIPPDALSSQIRAGISWNKVIQRELRPLVDVGDDEVDAMIERMKKSAGKDEYHVGEIFLAVDNPKDEDRIKQFADNLVQKLKSGGNFGSIANQFSQSSTAASGGDIGWVQQGQLPADLNRALMEMKPGDIAGPIRSASGFHILGLREKRTITIEEGGEESVELQQAFRPFGPTPDKEALLKETAKLQATITDCKDIAGSLAAGFPAWRWQDLGAVTLSRAPSWLADKVRKQPVGKATDAVSVNNGALVLFVCGRTTPQGTLNRDAIAGQIGTEKLELQSRRLLRDLRRNAYLDVRLSAS